MSEPEGTSLGTSSGTSSGSSGGAAVTPDGTASTLGLGLTARLVWAIVALNVIVLLGIAWAAAGVQARWSARHLESYQELFREARANERLQQALVQPGGSLADVDGVRVLLGLHRSSRHLFRDVVVVDNNTRGDDRLELNLFGAARREPGSFPRDAIFAGLAQAQEDRSVVPVGDGYCTPLLEGGEVVGAVWYALQVPPPPPPISLDLVLGAIGLGILVLALVTWWIVSRTVVRPIQRLNAAAQRLGAGEAQVQVPMERAAREITTLGGAFNVMAKKVEGHRDELRHEVEVAVAEAQRRERALLVSARLASIGTLAAGVAHEINNPIGGMQNAVHRLLQDPDRSPRDVRYLELVRDGLDRVRRIARRVLDFSPKSLQAAPFSLRAAFEDARALVEHRLKLSSVRLDVQLDESLPNVLGDRHEIQQVFLNLLLNSLDALESVGAGSPDSERSQTDESPIDDLRIEVAGKTVEREVVVSVADNGPGMDPALLERVLDPFFSDKGRPDASGLGMFITYNIVESHGGRLELSSAPGKGFRTVIHLPVAT